MPQEVEHRIGIVECQDVPRHYAGLTQAAIDHVSIGLLGLGPRMDVVLCNAMACEILGVARPCAWSAVSLDGLLADSARLSSADRLALVAALRDAVAPGQPAAAGARDKRAQVLFTDGHTLEVTIRPTPQATHLVTFTYPEVVLAAEHLDGLTGLPDRAGFASWLSARLAPADPAGREVPAEITIMLIDLYDFKSVNDLHGHATGDRVLQSVARRLRSAVREGDMVSRLGGDEFAMAVPALAAPEASAARLVSLLTKPYLVDGHVANFGASIGVATGPRDGADPAALLRAAELAMYRAKGAGRQAVRIFNQDMDAQVRMRHALLDDLRRALVLQEFELHYQPQTTLATGELVGFEALLRWRHSVHGLVPPDRFIPLAEEMGLIVPIGEWVLRAACQEALSWPDHLSVAVNVSAKQMASPDRLPQVVRAVLESTGLPAGRLEVELTESALVEYADTALVVMRALRAMGVRLSMDDFGTGYSSLSQLRSFPFDKLKIDRSFMRELAASEEAVAVVRAISALGTSLGMTTIAEGVETVEQRLVVTAEGCTEMQGYLVSRPVPAGELPALIARLRPAPPPAG